MLSQADFAKKLGVVFSIINEWENGVRHPNYIMQRKFAAFCEENKISKEQNLAYVEKENLYKKQEWMIGIE